MLQALLDPLAHPLQPRFQLHHWRAAVDLEVKLEVVVAQRGTGLVAPKHKGREGGTCV